jgi:hypothetical protein
MDAAQSRYDESHIVHFRRINRKRGKSRVLQTLPTARRDVGSDVSKLPPFCHLMSYKGFTALEVYKIAACHMVEAPQIEE